MKPAYKLKFKKKVIIIMNVCFTNITEYLVSLSPLTFNFEHTALNVGLVCFKSKDSLSVIALHYEKNRSYVNGITHFREPWSESSRMIEKIKKTLVSEPAQIYIFSQHMHIFIHGDIDYCSRSITITTA